MTETKGALAAALAQAQARARSVEKDAKNTFHKYAYASAEAILGEAKHALEGTGLALVPQNDAVAASPAVEGQPVSWVLTRGLLLVHSSGESIHLTTSWPIVPDKGRPLDKAVASARTTSLAYLLRDLLLMPRVAEGEDMDHGSRDERRDDRREEAPRGPAGRRREPAREEAPAPAPSRAAKATAEPDECQNCGGVGFCGPDASDGACGACGGSGVAPRPKAPATPVGPPALDAESVFRAAERTTLALVLERLQDPLVAQQILDPKRDPGVVDAALTAAVSKAAQAQGWPDSEIKNLWARVGKEPKRGAALVQVKAFVALLPDRKVPAA